MIRAQKKKVPRQRPPPTTIHSLPVEILRPLFLTLQDTASSQLEWIRLAWVCCLWREVALQTGPFWTQLRLLRPLDPSFVSELLSRSGQLDLDLEVNTTGNDIDNIKTVILNHAHRLRSLSITFNFDQTPVVQQVLRKFKPKLETLTLRAVYDGVAIQVNNDYAVSRLSLFTPDVPALRHLSVAGLVVNAPQDVLFALVSLELDGFEGDRFCRAGEWVHTILETTAPTLEHLTLKHVECLRAQAPLLFLQLQKLTMWDNNHASIVRFLNFARLPVTAKFDLRNSWHDITSPWKARSTTFADVMTLFPCYRTVREQALPVLFQTKVLRLHAGKNVYLTGRTNDATNTVWRVTANLQNLCNVVSDSMVLPLVRELANLLARETIEEYECHFSAHLDTFDAWPHAIRGFTNLRKFTFGATRAAEELLGDFRACKTSGFPTLEEMTLCVPEVAASTLAILHQIKKIRSSTGKAILPPVLRFRLPQRLATCRKTRAEIERLKVKMARITRVEEYFLDCGFCHRARKPRPPPFKVEKPQPPRELSANDLEYWKAGNSDPSIWA